MTVSEITGSKDHTDSHSKIAIGKSPGFYWSRVRQRGLIISPPHWALWCPDVTWKGKPCFITGWNCMSLIIGGTDVFNLYFNYEVLVYSCAHFSAWWAGPSFLTEFKSSLHIRSAVFSQLCTSQIYLFIYLFLLIHYWLCIFTEVFFL